MSCDCGDGTNPRQILKLPATGSLTEAQIKKAYRTCALKCHPDKYKEGDAEEKMKKINGAYEALLNNPYYAPPPNSQKPVGYKDKIKNLLTRLSQRKYNPTAIRVMVFDDILQIAEEYHVEDMMDIYEDHIKNFTLNPDFLPDYSESDYKIIYKETEWRGGDKEKHDFLLKQQVRWIMDLLSKNPREANKYLKIKPGETPPSVDPNVDQGINHKKFKLLLVQLSKIDYNPRVSEILTNEFLDEYFELYLQDKEDVIKKYRPLIMNYRLNPEFNDPYDHQDSYYKNVLKDISWDDDNEKKDRIITEQVIWILEALNKSAFGEADEALRYVTPVAASAAASDKTESWLYVDKSSTAPPQPKEPTPPPPKEPTPPPPKEPTPPPKKPAAAAPPASQKRCPKGTRRNKKTGACEPSGKKAATPTKPRSPSPPPKMPTPSPPKPAAAAQPQAQKRCPKGTRRNKKTGACDPTGKTAAPEPTKPRTPSPAAAPPASTKPTAKAQPQAQKRCPNGTRRNKKTGACEPK